MGVFGGENGVLGGVLNTVFGGPTGAEGQLGNYANAAFDSREMQRFLPAQLQNAFSGPVLASWIKNLGDLMRTPGGISPTIGAAIRPWLANESQSIAQNYRGLAENQAGAGARGNLPVSIRAALESALGANQERAQRQARNTAMGQSEQLRRMDISAIEPLLQALFQFTSTGRGQALQGFGAQAGLAQQRQAANEAFIASLLGSFSGAGMLGGKK